VGFPPYLPTANEVDQFNRIARSYLDISVIVPTDDLPVPLHDDEPLVEIEMLQKAADRQPGGQNPFLTVQRDLNRLAT
jgi:hypothetical protein